MKADAIPTLQPNVHICVNDENIRFKEEMYIRKPIKKERWIVRNIERMKDHFSVAQLFLCITNDVFFSWLVSAVIRKANYSKNYHQTLIPQNFKH